MPNPTPSKPAPPHRECNPVPPPLHEKPPGDCGDVVEGDEGGGTSGLGNKERHRGQSSETRRSRDR